MRSEPGAVAARSWIRLLMLVSVALTLAGCASPQNYLQRRAADLLDVVALELTVGPGMDVHVNVTRFVGTAVGASFQAGPMLYGRHVGVGARTSLGLLVAGTSGGALAIPSDEEQSRGWVWSLFMAAPSPDYVAWPMKGLRVWDFDIGASCIVGAHVGFNPAELLDFLVGFTTLDIGGDDCVTAPTGILSTAEPEPFQPFYWTPVHEALLDVGGALGALFAGPI